MSKAPSLSAITENGTKEVIKSKTTRKKSEPKIMGQPLTMEGISKLFESNEFKDGLSKMFSEITAERKNIPSHLESLPFSHGQRVFKGYESDIFERFPKKNIGMLGQQRSDIPKDLGGQIIFVLDYESQNIATEAAVELGITKDELFRNAIWIYLETATKK